MTSLILGPSCWVRLLHQAVLLAFVLLVISSCKGDRGTGIKFLRDIPQNVYATLGQRAVLRCRIVNLGENTVTWRRQDESHPLTVGSDVFASDSTITVESVYPSTELRNVSEWRLVIHYVRLQDEGVYHCQVTAKQLRRRSFEVRLLVKDIQVTGTQTVRIGNPIKLICNVTGNRMELRGVSWYRGSSLVHSNQRHGILVTRRFSKNLRSTQLVLDISASRPQDTGKYTCKTAFRLSTSIFVNVMPDAMAARVATANDSNDASTTVIPPPSDRRRVALLAAIVLLYVRDRYCCRQPS